MTIEASQVAEATALIVKYMEEQQAAYGHDRVPMEDTDAWMEGTGSFKGKDSDEPAHWDLAKQVCNEILDASHRDGHYGCQLCRS